MPRGPFLDMGEVCLKWADNLWYVGSASHKWFLATYGPIAEYWNSTKSSTRPITKYDQLRLVVSSGGYETSAIHSKIHSKQIK